MAAPASAAESRWRAKLQIPTRPRRFASARPPIPPIPAMPEAYWPPSGHAGAAAPERPSARVRGIQQEEVAAARVPLQEDPDVAEDHDGVVAGRKDAQPWERCLDERTCVSGDLRVS